MKTKPEIEPKRPACTSNAAGRRIIFALALLGLALAQAALASENVPHRPFAEWADVPEQGQGSIILFSDNTIYYPRDTRENNDSIEAGFSYTTSKRRIRYGFHSRTVVNGSNTDSKFWVGGSVDMPFEIPFLKQRP